MSPRSEIRRRVKAASRAVSLACAFLALLGARDATAQMTEADRGVARTYMAEGRALRDKHDLRGALARFQTAESLMHFPTTGYEIARTYADLGELLAARREAQRVVGRRGNVRTLAAHLRESAAEVRSLVEAKGVRPTDAARHLHAVVAALEGDMSADAGPHTSRRLTSEAVFDWLELHDVAASVRELRIVHDWTLAGVGAQIDELTSARSESARTEERLRFILLNARILVAEIDRQLRIQWIYDPRQVPEGADLIGRHIRELGEPELAEEIAQVVERVFQVGAGERMEISPGGPSPSHLLASLEPKRDANGAVSGVLVATTNITELKEAGLALGRAIAIWEQMVAVLAHDLKNPLGSVLALARLYAQKDELPAKVRQALSQIDLASQRMVELIDTLLDFSAARFGGALSVSRGYGDLFDVTSAAVDELRSTAPERAIVVRNTGDTRGAWDLPRMAQVVSNLVGNALTHGAAHFPVVVDVEGRSSHILLRVSNEGSPIEPELVPLLFEPFRRGTDACRRSRGLGLGLYIALEIVKAHGGTIRVESNIQRGTVFTVEVPRTSP